MALIYNQPRFSQSLLAKYKKSSPSFTIDLYDDHWTLNKGPSKFLYTQPVSGLLDEVRALRIPVDFIEIFDIAHVPYYEGCMIVESMDHRKPRLHHQQTTSKEPECIRVVLQPDAESIYADLCLLNAKSGNNWTDQEALEAESKILNSIYPSLCLDPDINLTRIVNTVIRASTPSDSVLSKRKQAHEPEEDENDKAKRAKLWSQFMHPHHGKPSSQAQHKRSIFDILNEVAHKDEKGVYGLKWKQVRSDAASLQSQGQPQNNHTFAPPNATNTSPSVLSSVSQDDGKMKPKAKTIKKPDVTETQAALNKGKKKPASTPSAPVPVPSPVPEQRKSGPVAPSASRTPVDSAAISPNPPAQFQQLSQPSVSPHPPAFPVPLPPVMDNNQSKKKGVLKKPEEQTAQPPAQQPPPHQANPVDPQAAWQAPMPSAQYLSQPPQGKKKQSTQPQQVSPFHAHTQVPGFANNSAYVQNTGYKNPGGMVQNPNLNSHRGSPMTPNQPLLSRDPLPPHSQSPHPPSQPQQSPTTPQNQVSHPSHQFNMHMQQNRFNPVLGQPGHPQTMPQHPIPQHVPQNAGRNVQGQHDPSQAMMHPQMHYNPMAPYPYQQMHMQGMMNGVRMPNMPGAQASGGQYMAGPGWRLPAAGRGGGPPMTTIPMHNQQFQQQQQQMLAALNRAQAQQTQPLGQGR